MVLVLVLGAGLGWLAREVQRARAQRKAVAAIEQLGGSVEYKPASGGMIRTAVAWVGKLISEDLSGDVATVSLHGTSVSDAGLEHLRQLTQLRELPDCRRHCRTAKSNDDLSTDHHPEAPTPLAAVQPADVAGGGTRAWRRVRDRSHPNAVRS